MIRGSVTQLPVLAIENLTAQYGSTRVLHGIDISVQPGEVHAILGPNGSGKSTLLKSIDGNSTRTTGRVEFPARERVLREDRPSGTRSKNANVVHQDLALFESLTVTENVLLGGMGLPRTGFGLVRWRAAHQAARDALDQLGVRVDVRSTVDRLSRRNQTFVAIARAVNSMPDSHGVLFLDEVTASLDEADATQLLEQVTNLAVRQSHGIVLITHRLDEVWKYADFVTVLRDGRTVVQGPVNDAVQEEVLSAFDKGAPARVSESRTPQPAMSAAGIRTRLAVNRAWSGMVKDVSFELHEHEILGVTSLAGAGKEDLVALLSGTASLDRGSVSVDGVALEDIRREDMVARGVGLVPANRSTESVIGPLSAADNLLLLNFGRARRYGLTTTRRVQQISIPSMRDFSVSPPDPGRTLAEFSGGNQQKVVIARWLAFDYNTVILVEPTAGVDVAARGIIYNAIREKRNRGASFLVISSDNTELVTLCDRVIVLRDGQIVEVLANEYLTEDALVRASVLDGRSRHAD